MSILSAIGATAIVCSIGYFGTVGVLVTFFGWCP